MNVKFVFIYMEEDMLRKLIMKITQSRLEYATVVWSPYLKRHKQIGDGTENGINELPYKKILQKLRLPMFWSRREI